MPHKILIADDEPHMLRLIEVSLRKGGFQIVQARDGREAVAVAIREKPDLVVMDLVMPELDGFAALRELKLNADTAHTPVILLTSRGQAIVREEAERSGAALYLQKPFSPAQLLVEAKRLLGLA
ncbi:MAG: response regulator [Verrucomicrobiota bacterium]